LKCKEGYKLNKDSNICVNIMNDFGLKLLNCDKISTDGSECELCDPDFGIYKDDVTQKMVCDTAITLIENCWAVEN